MVRIVKRMLLTALIAAGATALSCALGSLTVGAGPYVFGYPALLVVALIYGVEETLVALVLIAAFTVFAQAMGFITSPPSSALLAAASFLVTGATVLWLARRLLVASGVASPLDATGQRLSLESQLALSERRFGRMADISPAVIYVYDLTLGKNVYINRRFADILSRPALAGAAVGEAVHELVHPDDVPTVRAAHRALMMAADGEVVPYEIRFRHAEGHYIWFLQRSTVFARDAIGHPVQILGSGEDITARKLSEQALQASEERFRLASEAVPGIVYEARWPGEQVERSGALLRITGFMPTDATATVAWWWARVHPKDRPQPADLYSGERFSIEYRFMHQDGQWRDFWDRGIVQRDGQGALQRVIGAVTDVTARRNAERALQASRSRFERVAETMADVVHILDFGERRTIYVNRRVQEVLGYTPDELVGFEPGALLGLVDAGDEAVVQSRRYRQSMLADGEVLQTEFRMRHRDGRLRWLQARETIFEREPSGQPSQILGILSDVTELRESRQALQDDARRKDEFLAMLAHELRNPLAPIRSAAQVIRLSDASAPEPVRRAREVIERQSEHMARLVDDLLDVSRTTTGKISLIREPIALSVLIARAVELVGPMAERRAQRIEVTSASEAVILVDVARMVQVLGNLLGNALKYSDEHATVELSTALDDAGLAIAVRDHGMGIAAEFLPRVFELFSQDAISLDRSQGGLGIGLTLVRSLMELHGGSVTAESDGPGKGSCFTIRLPASSVTRKAEVAPRPVAQDARPRDLLLVDDNVDSAQMLGLVLASQGHRLAIEHDGPSALATAARQRFDVAVLDIGLPGMNGFELARQLRARPDPPVLIALTGYSQPEDRKRSRDAGFALHLVKPVDPLLLCEAIATLPLRDEPSLSDTAI